MENVEIVYMQNESKLVQKAVAYLWEEIWWLRAFLKCVAMRLYGIFIMKKQLETLNLPKPNPRR